MDIILAIAAIKIFHYALTKDLEHKSEHHLRYEDIQKLLNKRPW